MLKKGFGLSVVLLLSLFLGFSPGAVGAETLEIPGTGACEVLLRALAEAFNVNRTDRVMVPPSIGSSGGIRAVIGDQAIMARVAQPLKDQEKAHGLRYLVFSRDLVIFAGGARVMVKNLTQAQLLDIYAGKITDWRELGGGPAPIRVLARQPGDSSLLVIQEHLPEFRNITFPQGVKMPHTDPKMLQLVEKYKYSIAWLTFSALKGTQATIHPLALDGIAPTPENARSGKYQLICDYALVFKETRLNNLARSFIDFIFSKPAQQLMKQYGVIPVDKE